VLLLLFATVQQTGTYSLRGVSLPVWHDFPAALLLLLTSRAQCCGRTVVQAVLGVVCTASPCCLLAEQAGAPTSLH
jgi:hypothetical protein